MQTLRWDSQTGRIRSLLSAILAAACLAVPSSAWADEENEADKRPVLLITVESPLTDVQVGRVKNAALTLQTKANQQSQSGLLFLEIQPGSSEFSEVWGLADWLTTEINNVTTVAWIPETVLGNNVIVALACREIVMAPDAELGDIGRGQPLEENRQEYILDIVAKSNNNKVSPALVRKMMDRSIELHRITLQQGEQETTEVVTGEGLKRLQDQKAVIKETRLLLDGATVGILSGEKARRADVLVTQTAGSLNELADTYKIQPSDLREDPAIAGELKPRLIKIEGTIEPMMAASIKRLIGRAVADGANLIIFEVDSPGGYMETMWELRYAITDLSDQKVRTVAYIPKIAMSAAAVISLACDEVYLQPDAKIGDAGPITIREGQAFEHVPEKQLSPIRTELESLAELKHRPAAVLQAMADRNLVVYEARNKETGEIWYMSENELHEKSDTWEKGPIVPESEKGQFLTVTGADAHDLKIAEPPVNDREELKQRLGIPAETKLTPMEEGWLDSLIFKLNSPQWTGTLFTIAMLCLFLELHLMTGLLAIISGLCFALFFWARYMGGTAGWLEVILFVGGLICLAIELFVVPGFGVFGVSGGLMVLASLILASQTFGQTWGADDGMERFTTTVKTLTISIGAVVVIGAVINRYLPHIPLFNAIILHPPAAAAEEKGPQLHPGMGGFDTDSPYAELYGLTGTAQSVLRPAGKARIGDRMVDVVSDGPYIQPGSQIEVVEVAGNRVVVREV